MVSVRLRSMSATMNFGERLRLLRESRGWTRERLAAKVRCSVSYLKELEGKPSPPVGGEVVGRLEDLFRVSLTDPAASPVSAAPPVSATDLTDAQLLTELANRLARRPVADPGGDDGDDLVWGDFEEGHDVEQQ